MSNTIHELIAASLTAYRALENDGDTDEVYAALTAAYAAHGLDANVAESSVDWLEGGSLTESLEQALNKVDPPSNVRIVIDFDDGKWDPDLCPYCSKVISDLDDDGMEDDDGQRWCRSHYSDERRDDFRDENR